VTVSGDVDVSEVYQLTVAWMALSHDVVAIPV
jgi:hypothetical protein